MESGESYLVKKVNTAEFILYAKREISELFAEGVTLKSHDKFADILEILNAVCEALDMDWYECSKIKSAKRWEVGTFKGYLAEKVTPHD